MDTPLLTTKLHIPPPLPTLVERPRLLERLDTGLHLGKRLTLVSAPAGFGKTTLLSEWVQAMRGATVPMAVAAGASQRTPGAMPTGAPSGMRLDRRHRGQGVSRTGWLSLDESDNDPVRFLTYFIAALNRVERIESTIGEGALGMLQSPQPPTEDALTSLINEIATLPDRIILILDDYHMVVSSPVDDAITFLLEHLPPQLHLVISTRDDPYLPLARLRARGQLNELRAADLRFTSSEAAEFLNHVMGLDLSVEDVTALETRTEGWIVGLQLAAISMQGCEDAADFIKSFTGSHHFVLDYLVEEVLHQQSEGVQTFLSQTAVLNRLTGSLCDALTGQEDGQATLEMLEHANLFVVPLDEERCWYRYHHLFADLLRQRLRQTQSEQLPVLHSRASKWYEQSGFIDEAIAHALQAEDFERAACLIKDHVDRIWERGEHTKLRRWLARLPVELVWSKPHLCILNAWDLFTGGQHAAAERSLQAVEQAMDTAADRVAESSPLEGEQLPGSDRMQLLGRVAAIRAFLASYRGDVPGTIRYSRQALEYLPEHDFNWRCAATIALGDACSFGGELEEAYKARVEALEASKARGNINMIAGLKLADTHKQQGQLHRAMAICQQQLQLAHEGGLSQTVAVGWLLAIWGEVLAELNDLDQALHQAKKGVKLAERGKDVMVIGWSNLCLTRVLFSRGDIAGADKIIQKMENFARKHDLPPFITNLMAAWQARIWLAQDKLAAASQWVQERGLDVEGGTTLLREREYMVLARILAAQGRLDETDGLLQCLLEAAEMTGHTRRAIELLALRALTFQAKGDTERAINTLERALLLAEPGGFIRIFVDEGPPMAALLTRMQAEDGRTREYARKLLAVFSGTESCHSSLGPQPLIEPLSERELEVLQLIAQGLTNQEIAGRLFLSLHTVKVHTRNIYGKLDAHNRTQAVARARVLGVLPPT